MIFEEMLKEERAAGFAKGRAEGVAEGRISESKDTLLLFLQNLGTVPKVLRIKLKNKVIGCTERVDQDGIPIEICGRICKEDKIRIYIGEYPI